MSAHAQSRRRYKEACALGCVVALIGGGAWWLRLGEGISYDLPFAFSRPVIPENMVIVAMDEASHKELDQEHGKPWRRSLHAALLRKLKAERSGPVIFDVFLAEARGANEDDDFANAVREHGQVVLAADVSETAQPGIAGKQVRAPLEKLRRAALAWGISEVTREPDGSVRRHPAELELYPSLPWAAAVAAGAEATGNSAARFGERWLRYYGRRSGIPLLSYYAVSNQAAGFFTDKIVLVGGQPRTRYIGEEVDEFPCAYTLWGGKLSSGVELQGTMVLNLVRGDWLVRIGSLAEFGGIVLASFGVGFLMRLIKPIDGAVVGGLIAAGVSAAAVISALHAGTWFSWVTLAGFALPAAWLGSLAMYKQRESAVVESYPKEPPMEFGAGEGSQIQIPDYALLKRIGRGAYGEVWLGRNRVGLYHAVKIIQNRFSEVTPYEREFRGIRSYMPVSLKHQGLVRILYVGRNDQAGYFYYVMELGDDEGTGQTIDVAKYSARNLAKDLEKRERLTVAETLALGVALSEPLEFLHQSGLLHRDIKPANIIYIEGVPKLADIGLVSEVARTGTEASSVGTEFYMDPDGPSKPCSDIYSFGKVMYEASTGLHVKEFPRLPDPVLNAAEVAEFMGLNSIILKCCERTRRKRFQSVAELREALLALERRINRAKEVA